MRVTTGVFSAVRMPDATDWWVEPAIRRCRKIAAQSDHPFSAWDVVASSAGPYTSHLVAMQVKRLGLARTWIGEFRDLWTDNHLYRGLFPFTIRERRLESDCLSIMDAAVTVSDGLSAQLHKRMSGPIHVIYNGFDAVGSSLVSSEPIFPDDDTIRIVYTGTLYQQAQDPTPMLKALACAQIEKNIKIVIAGRDGDEWMRMAQRYRVEQRMDIRGTVNRADALRMQRDADALLLLDWNDPHRGVLTGKVFEYLNASAPILIVGGSPSSPIARLVHRACRGVHLGSDIQRNREALTTLMTDPARLASLPDRPFINSFSRENQSQRLLDIITRLAAERA